MSRVQRRGNNRVSAMQGSGNRDFMPRSSRGLSAVLWQPYDRVPPVPRYQLETEAGHLPPLIWVWTRKSLADHLPFRRASCVSPNTKCIGEFQSIGPNNAELFKGEAK